MYNVSNMLPRKHRRHGIFLSVLFVLPWLLSAQVQFRTVVPQRPIVVGESIQVQYIASNAAEIKNFSHPLFPGFRYVTGPNIYTGTTTDANGNNISYKNMVITVVATQKGRIAIGGASCEINGTVYKSNDAVVEVISAQEAEELKGKGQYNEDSPFYLGPGQDAMKKIAKNLFLKLSVDKRDCTVGEPIVATFKLYSRLQSISDVEKNPGFYGFGVYDIININDRVQTAEKINGQWYDVHIVRKAQLYPLQAGLFVIDPMEISNKVTFSRNQQYGKTEQEVTENMYGAKENDTKADAGTEVFEMDIKSEPISIRVKPLPGKNVTDTFAGAVGNFSINAELEKDTALKNEENALILTVSGSGNFQQVNVPSVKWPEGLEVFEPTMTDSLDKKQVPLAGSRIFRYVFVSDKPGLYSIPSFEFSFYDIRAKQYRSVTTSPVQLFVSHKSKEHVAVSSATRLPRKKGNNKLWWLAGFSVIIIAAVYFTWRKLRRDDQLRLEALRRQQEAAQPPPIVLDDLLKPAQIALHIDDRSFYTALSGAIWNYFNKRLQITGSKANKNVLSALFTNTSLEPGMATDLLKIIEQCEAGIYTHADLGVNKEELLADTKSILSRIEKTFQS